MAIWKNPLNVAKVAPSTAGPEDFIQKAMDRYLSGVPSNQIIGSDLSDIYSNPYEKLEKMYADYRRNSSPAWAPTMNYTPPLTNEKALQMIGMRLRWKEGEVFPLKYISAYVTPSTAVVFVVNGDEKPVILEDDPNLFPSDKLITELRLLIG